MLCFCSFCNAGQGEVVIEIKMEKAIDMTITTWLWTSHGPSTRLQWSVQAIPICPCWASKSESPLWTWSCWAWIVHTCWLSATWYAVYSGPMRCNIEWTWWTIRWCFTVCVKFCLHCSVDLLCVEWLCGFPCVGRQLLDGWYVNQLWWMDVWQDRVVC